MRGPLHPKALAGGIPTLAVALIFALPSPLSAQQSGNSDEGEVQVVGSVAPICVLGQPSESVIDLGTLINLSGPRIGRMAALAPRQVTMPGSFCNYANTMISITASAMTEQTGAPLNTGFSRTVNYRVVVSPWANIEADLLTSAAPDGSGHAGPVHGFGRRRQQGLEAVQQLVEFFHQPRQQGE